MSRSNRSLGIRSFPDNVIANYPNWFTQLRKVTSADGSSDSVSDSDGIDLRKSGLNAGSRFASNTITLLALLSGFTGATVALYLRELDGAGDPVDYLVRSDAITESSLLTYLNLPPLLFIPVVTSVTGTPGYVEIGGGGTF